MPHARLTPMPLYQVTDKNGTLLGTVDAPNGTEAIAIVHERMHEALIALKQRVPPDTLLNMLNAWEARTKGATAAVPYEHGE